MLWLEGFDNEPKYILQSELANVSYTNLAAGDYVFHVGVMDGKKTKMFSESLYRVHKENEFYSNWWFVLYVVLVFALAMVYISWLIFRTKIQKRSKNRTKKSKTKISSRKRKFFKIKDYKTDINKYKSP